MMFRPSYGKSVFALQEKACVYVEKFLTSTTSRRKRHAQQSLKIVKVSGGNYNLAAQYAVVGLTIQLHRFIFA